MADIFFDIFGRDHNVGQTFDEIAGKGHGVTKALGGIGLAAAGLGLAAVLKTGYEEATDAATGVAQLEAGIKSTGGAAGVTVGQLTELASSIQEYSGQTDDSIIKTEQLLLTFTNIRNVGADKIFDDTTRAAADMAAKFGGDASQQAIVLGKALNDPVQGLTALRRVGVSFTEAQQEQIKAMARSGDVMGAQKAILAELTKEFGGSAEAAGKTLPGQLAIARRSFEDISQNLVTGLLPVMQRVVGGVQSLMSWFKGLTPEMQSTVVTIVTVVAVGAPLLLLIGSLAGAFTQVIAVVKIAQTAFLAMNAVMAANPIGIVILALAALVASLVFAYNNVGWFKDFVDSAFRAIQQVISVVVNYVTGVLVPNFQTSFSNISNFIQNGVQAFSNFSQGVSRGIQDAINWVTQLPGRILGALSGLGGLLVGIGASIINGFLQGLQSSWRGVTDFIGGIGAWIAANKGPEEYDRGLLVPHGGWIIGGLNKGLRGAIPDLLGTLGDVSDSISGHFAGNASGSLVGSPGRASSAPGTLDLHGYSLKLNADATMATFERIAGSSANAAVGDANDDIYRGRAR